jgi:hypothetical protein
MVSSPFPDAGQGYSRMSTVFADAAEQMTSLQQQIGESQQGASAEAAMTRLQGHQRYLEALHERCTTVTTVSAIQADADNALLQAPGPKDVELAEEKMKAARMAGNIALYKARMDELDAITDERHAALESHKSASEQSSATLKSLTDITLPREHRGGGVQGTDGGDGDGGIEQGAEENDEDRWFDGKGLPRDTPMPREHQGVEPSRDTVMPRVHDGTPPPDTSTHLSSSAAPPASPQPLGGMASQPAMGSGAPGGMPTMGLPQAVAGMGNGSAQGGKSGERGSRRRRDEDDDTKKWRDGLERLLAEPAPISVAPVAPAMPSPSSAGMSPTTHLSGGSIPTAPAPAAPATGTPPMGGGGGGVPLGGGAAQHIRNSTKPPNITEVMPPEPLPGTAYADAPDGKSDERKSA